VKTLPEADRRDLRFLWFATAIAISLVASEMARWPAGPTVDARMLFGLAAPLVVGGLLTERRERLGLGIGSLTRGAMVLGIGVPLAVAAVFILAESDAVRRHYGGHSTSPLALALGYGPGILQVELCFRGVVLFGLRDVVPPIPAVALAVLPYALIHLDKPMLEALGSVPVGIALGVAAIWTRSVWYGLLVHLVGAVALTLFCGR